MNKLITTFIALLFLALQTGIAQDATEGAAEMDLMPYLFWSIGIVLVGMFIILGKTIISLAENLKSKD